MDQFRDPPPDYPHHEYDNNVIQNHRSFHRGQVTDNSNLSYTGSSTYGFATINSTDSLFNNLNTASGDSAYVINNGQPALPKPRNSDVKLPKVRKTYWFNRFVIGVVSILGLLLIAATAFSLPFLILKDEIANAGANVGNTPLDGLWTDWKAWSNCSAACGNGSMTRTRTCTNPSPSLGGRDCEGSDNETKDCMMMECPVDGNWTDWQAWGNCSETCGNGVRIRNRTCENPSPSSGGNDCEGSASDTQNCTLIPCPINGNWGSWQIWSDCSTTCGVGVMNRSRECDNPPPQYDGEDCVGPASETSTCANITCPPPGTWNNWSTWTDCSVSCGQGISRRTRTCDDSAGGDCIGADLETKGCQIFKCYDSWGIWSDCSLTCGAGLRSRNRTCDGKYTGQECGWHTPTFVDVKSCDNTINCPDSFCASRSANCSYNHPNRCDMYITCDARKVMHEQICNVLLLYKVRQSDECKGDCDWAANVQCP